MGEPRDPGGLDDRIMVEKMEKTKMEKPENKEVGGF